MGAIFVATGGRTGSDQWSTGRLANPHRGWGFRVAALLGAKWKIATGDVPQITKKFWHQKKGNQILIPHSIISMTSWVKRCFERFIEPFTQDMDDRSVPSKPLKPPAAVPSAKVQGIFFYKTQLPALAWILVLVDVSFHDFLWRAWPSLTTSWLDPSTLVPPFSIWVV